MKELTTWFEQQNITQAEMAKRMGFTEAYVSFVLRGLRPISGEFKWRFAEAFGHDVAAQLFSNGTEEVTSE